MLFRLIRVKHPKWKVKWYFSNYGTHYHHKCSGSLWNLLVEEQQWFFGHCPHGMLNTVVTSTDDDVIKCKHFPRYRPFVRGIHRSPGNSPRKDQWRGALMFSLICVLINDWVNTGEAGDLGRYRAHYDVTVIFAVITGGQYNKTNEKLYTKCICTGINSLRPRQMDAISQTTFSNAFSWMKMFEFRLKFHWIWFPRVQLTIIKLWFR